MTDVSTRPAGQRLRSRADGRGAAAGSNPLRDPRDKRLPRIAGPSSVVIFGVTGDLSRKKLMPAIYDLANRGLLPPGFGLVGFARREWGRDDFERVVHDAVAQNARTPFREDVWEHLAEGFHAAFLQAFLQAHPAASGSPRCSAPTRS